MSKKLLIIIIIVVIVLGGAVFFLFNKKFPQTAQVSNSINEYPSVSDSIEQSYNIAPSKENKENKIYTDLQYNFSFQYPKDFTATKFQEGEEGSTILVQKTPSTGSGQAAFQIFISPFDEPGPLTAERVKQDLPDLIIKNPEQRVLKNGAKALIFFSEEPSLGQTREIWFVHNNFLYQISTYKELDSLVADILSTWEFH